MTSQENHTTHSDDSYYVEMKELYLRCWHNCLNCFLNWPHEQITKWSQKWEDRLNGNDQGWFYHETALYYIVIFIIPDSIRAQIDSSQLIKLEGRLESVILHTGLGDWYLREGEDMNWIKAKQRIESVLNEYGETLNNIQYPVMVQRLAPRQS
jgi:hypothetical protein